MSCACKYQHLHYYHYVAAHSWNYCSETDLTQHSSFLHLFRTELLHLISLQYILQNLLIHHQVLETTDIDDENIKKAIWGPSQ